MPVDVMNPDNLDPEETHEYPEGTEVRIDGVPGVVIDRGYTVPGNKPVYAAKCDDNIERTAVESNLEVLKVPDDPGF